MVNHQLSTINHQPSTNNHQPSTKFMSEPESVELKGKKITPLRCLVGASISGALGSGLYLLTAAIAQTYAAKPITSTNPIVLNISVAVRTLVVGIVALGTFVFLFVAIGLILLAIQVIIQSFKQRDTSSADK